MNEFVDECRREWTRLGVQKAIADEMAAELTADLEEGASPGDVLGTDAADPRSFAARWARERGVIQRRRWASRIPAALATFALVPAIVGAVLLIVASPARERRVVVPPPPPTTIALSVPAQTPERVRAQMWTSYAALSENQALRSRLFVLGDTKGPSNDDDHTLGSVLLIVGLALVAPLTLFWLWRGFKRA